MAFPLHLVLGILGNATSLALYLSPMATFWGIFKLKSTQQYSGFPYVCTLFNCALWLLYGSPFVKPHSTLLLTINGAGFGLELFYLMSFLTFASKKKKGTHASHNYAFYRAINANFQGLVKTMRLTFAMTMALAMVIAVTIFVLHTYSARQLVAGTLGVVLSIVMYASPLSVVKLVISTKSVEYMPFLLSFCNLVNSLAWSSYALVTRDIFVAVPNGVGFILGIVQLTVYCMYRNSKPDLSANAELPLKKVQLDTNVPAIVSSSPMSVPEKTNPSTVDPTLVNDQV
eukprot:Gb_11313 [translate_table: standard]